MLFDNSIEPDRTLLFTISHENLYDQSKIQETSIKNTIKHSKFSKILIGSVIHGIKGLMPDTYDSNDNTDDGEDQHNSEQDTTNHHNTEQIKSLIPCIT